MTYPARENLLRPSAQTEICLHIAPVTYPPYRVVHNIIISKDPTTRQQNAPNYVLKFKQNIPGIIPRTASLQTLSSHSQKDREMAETHGKGAGGTDGKKGRGNPSELPHGKLHRTADLLPGNQLLDVPVSWLPEHDVVLGSFVGERDRRDDVSRHVDPEQRDRAERQRNDDEDEQKKR